MSMSDEEYRRDALERALINTISYQCKEWDLTQRDVIACLKDVTGRVAELFLRGNRDANRKFPKRDDDAKDTTDDE